MSTLFYVLAGLFAVTGLIGAINPLWLDKKKPLKRGEALGGGLFAAAIFIGLAWYFAPPPAQVADPTGQTDFYSRVKAKSQKIAGIELLPAGQNPILLVTLSESSIWSERLLLVSESMRMKELAKFILAQPDAPEFKRLDFAIVAPVRDNYGNERQAEILRLGFADSELRKINWENIYNWDFMNLVGQVNSSTAGLNVISELCASEGKNYANFCRKSLSLLK